MSTHILAASTFVPVLEYFSGLTLNLNVKHGLHCWLRSWARHQARTPLLCWSTTRYYHTSLLQHQTFHFGCLASITQHSIGLTVQERLIICPWGHFSLCLEIKKTIAGLNVQQIDRPTSNMIQCSVGWFCAPWQLGEEIVMSILHSFARSSFQKCLGSQNLYCFVLCPAPYISSGWVAMSVAPLVCHALLAPYMEGPQQTLYSTTPVTNITVIGHLGFKQHFCGFLSKIVFWVFDPDCRLRVSWP